MKLLVTGGAGYIGSVVANQLLEAGHETVVFDDLSKGYERAVPERYNNVCGTLNLLEAMSEAGVGWLVFSSTAAVYGASKLAVDHLRSELGWKPEKPALDAMISDAWRWMRAHPNGYE